jgi:glyoxylase-like metal-dependent hydrolase (beta-lactamase superfamily II)
MAAPAPPLTFDTHFEPQTGTPVRVAPGIVRITAPNAGAFTFKGTNTYVLGNTTLAIVDPGPMSRPHLDALMAHIGGRRVEAIILTHTHKDHSALVHEFVEKIDAPLWFEGPHRPSRPRRFLERDWVARASDYGLMPDHALKEGEHVSVAGFDLQVIATPGHCANHLCFGIGGTPWLLSGDHVMGWNSTMIAVPDGSMAAYLDSLRRLIALPWRHYLPGHGGPINDGPGYARALLAHREMRNEEIVRAVSAGANGIGELTRIIYPKLALPLIPAARMTLTAHVEYLAAAGRIRATQWILGGWRLAPA